MFRLRGKFPFMPHRTARGAKFVEQFGRSPVWAPGKFGNARAPMARRSCDIPRGWTTFVHNSDGSLIIKSEFLGPEPDHKYFVYLGSDTTKLLSETLRG